MYFKKVKNMSDLNKLRAKINEIDEKMLDLFKERMNCAKDVALYKKENNIAIFDPKREQEVILKNSEKLNNPELLSEYKNFIQALMDSSKLYQRKIVYGETVGYQGVEGAFSNICANELFKGANFKAFNSFNDVLTAIEKEEKASLYRPVVYICSPYSGDVDANINNARRYCRFAVDEGYIPIAPHLLFPQFMSDDNETERELALFMDMVIMSKCAEVWVFGEHISNGMKAEISKAKRKNQQIRYFNDKCEEVSR